MPAATAERRCTLRAGQHSPIMLTYFGLPSLALYGGNIVKWQNVVLHTQHRACDTSTPILNGHTIANSNITYGPSWSGFGNQCNGYICYNMEGADYQFLVPSIDRASTYEAVSHWVGVGGANGDALAQTGVFESTYNWLNTEETFYESEGCNGTPGGMQTGYTVNTNDSMYFFANWQGSEYMDDYTSNTYEAKVWGCGANDGAEFITERISNSGGGRWKLANFHKIIAHYAEFEDSNGSWHDLYYVGPFGGGIYQWVLQNPQYQYMITFPSWPVADTGYGSTWESDFVRGT